MLPQRHGPSESKEEIINKVDETELGIVRTREVHVQLSSRSSLDGFDFDVHVGKERPVAASQQ